MIFFNFWQSLRMRGLTITKNETSVKLFIQGKMVFCLGPLNTSWFQSSDRLMETVDWQSGIDSSMFMLVSRSYELSNYCLVYSILGHTRWIFQHWFMLFFEMAYLIKHFWYCQNLVIPNPSFGMISCYSSLQLNTSDFSVML